MKEDDGVDPDQELSRFDLTGKQKNLLDRIDESLGEMGPQTGQVIGVEWIYEYKEKFDFSKRSRCQLGCKGLCMIPTTRDGQLNPVLDITNISELCKVTPVENLKLTCMDIRGSWDTQKFEGLAWQFIAKLKLHELHVQSETDYWKFSDAVEWTRHALLVQLYFIVDKFAICDFTKEAEWDYAWAYESEHEQPIDVGDL